MPKAGVRKKTARPNAESDSFDEGFKREITELKADLARLEASLSPTSGTPAKKKRPRKSVKRRASEVAEAMPFPVAPATAEAAVPTRNAAAAPFTPLEPLPTPGPPPVLASPVPPQGATRTDLADPKNFGLMPPLADLERGTTSDDEYHQRLARHLAFATRVLHTSRVPAAVWREWRVFEKAVQERLRTLASRPIMD